MTRTETPWGPWEPLDDRGAAALFRDAAFPWWIAGGYAIEAFVGRPLREHGDVDIGVFRDEHLEVREYLTGWDVHCADPPGALRPWPSGELLPGAVHDIWVRETADGPWRFQLMLNEREGDQWVYRRDPRTRRSIAALTFERKGVRYLVPEVQLLFKSKGMREKDVADFEAALPLLSGRARSWLATHLELEMHGHPWLELLA